MIGSLHRCALSRITFAHPDDDTFARPDGGRVDSGCECAEGLRITADGRWLCGVDIVSRPDLLSLFAGCLRRLEDGGYALDLPSGPTPVTVDDAPFVGVQLFAAGGLGESQSLSVLTNLDEIITLGAENPLRVVFDDGRTGGQVACYVGVRPGLEARLMPEVFNALTARGVERYENGVPCLGVWSCGTFFSLGRLDDNGALRAASA